MQLIFETDKQKYFDISNIDLLDSQTEQRLHSLGIHNGSKLSVVRFFPFHGPVIVSVDHQRIGIRYEVFKLITGGM